ncbi:uncharacterized protein LOC144295094 [Canis aureus]
MSKGAVHALWATRPGTAVSCPSPGAISIHPEAQAESETRRAPVGTDPEGCVPRTRPRRRTLPAPQPPWERCPARPGPARPGLPAAEPQAALLFSRKAEARRGCDGAPLAGGIHSVKFLQFLGHPRKQ